ncbi:MAG: hypothetical protein QM715_16895 [Nibricoccus sp.]
MPKAKTTILTLARSGGVAGIRPPPKMLDTASLTAEMTRRLEELLTAADFFSLPGELPSKAKGADGFQHTLTVQHASGRKHTVTFAEADASEPLRELKRLVRDQAG